jgi:hypothetical protein
MVVAEHRPGQGSHRSLMAHHEQPVGLTLTCLRLGNQLTVGLHACGDSFYPGTCR